MSDKKATFYQNHDEGDTTELATTLLYESSEDKYKLASMPAAPTREGYDFLGWTEERDVSSQSSLNYVNENTTFAANDASKYLNGVMLYAQWTPVHKVTVDIVGLAVALTKSTSRSTDYGSPYHREGSTVTIDFGPLQIAGYESHVKSVWVDDTLLVPDSQGTNLSPVVFEDLSEDHHVQIEVETKYVGTSEPDSPDDTPGDDGGSDSGDPDTPGGGNDDGGGSGGNEPDTPGGGNEPGTPSGGNEPDNPGGGNDDGGGSGGNEPDTPGGGSGGNEPGTPSGGSEPSTPGTEKTTEYYSVETGITGAPKSAGATITGSKRLTAEQWIEDYPDGYKVRWEVPEGYHVVRVTLDDIVRPDLLDRKSVTFQKVTETHTVQVRLAQDSPPSSGTGGAGTGSGSGSGTGSETGDGGEGGSGGSTGDSQGGSGDEEEIIPGIVEIPGAPGGSVDETETTVYVVADLTGGPGKVTPTFEVERGMDAVIHVVVEDTNNYQIGTVELLDANGVTLATLSGTEASSGTGYAWNPGAGTEANPGCLNLTNVQQTYTVNVRLQPKTQAGTVAVANTDQIKVTTSQTGIGGTVTETTVVKRGSNHTVTWEVEPGWYVKSVTLDGSQSYHNKKPEATPAVTAAVQMTQAVLERTADASMLMVADTQDLGAGGQTVDDLTGNEEVVGTIDNQPYGGSLSYQNIQNSHSVHVTFAQLDPPPAQDKPGGPYDVTVKLVGDGVLDYTSSATLEHGENHEVTWKAINEDGSVVSKVFVNGQERPELVRDDGEVEGKFLIESIDQSYVIELVLAQVGGLGAYVNEEPIYDGAVSVPLSTGQLHIRGVLDHNTGQTYPCSYEIVSGDRSVGVLAEEGDHGVLTLERAGTVTVHIAATQKVNGVLPAPYDITVNVYGQTGLIIKQHEGANARFSSEGMAVGLRLLEQVEIISNGEAESWAQSVAPAGAEFLGWTEDPRTNLLVAHNDTIGPRVTTLYPVYGSLNGGMGTLPGTGDEGGTGDGTPTTPGTDPDPSAPGSGSTGGSTGGTPSGGDDDDSGSTGGTSGGTTPVEVPAVEYGKHVSTERTDGMLMVGDVLHYAVFARNNHLAPAWANVTVRDLLPIGVSLVPGTVTLTKTAVVTAGLPEQEAVDEPVAVAAGSGIRQYDYYATDHLLLVNLGTVAPGEGYVLEFDVALNDDAPEAASLEGIVNQATVIGTVAKTTSETPSGGGSGTTDPDNPGTGTGSGDTPTTPGTGVTDPDDPSGTGSGITNPDNPDDPSGGGDNEDPDGPGSGTTGGDDTDNPNPGTGIIDPDDPSGSGSGSTNPTNPTDPPGGGDDDQDPNQPSGGSTGGDDLDNPNPGTPDPSNPGTPDPTNPDNPGGSGGGDGNGNGDDGDDDDDGTDTPTTPEPVIEPSLPPNTVVGGLTVGVPLPGTDDSGSGSDTGDGGSGSDSGSSGSGTGAGTGGPSRAPLVGWHDPVLATTKTVRNLTEPGSVRTQVGDRISYTLTATNTAANSLSTDTIFFDPLPEGLTVDTSSFVLTLPSGEQVRVGAAAYNPATRTISLHGGELKGGETCSFTFSAVVNEQARGSVLVNVGYVFDSAQMDLGGSSDSDGSGDGGTSGSTGTGTGGTGTATGGQAGGSGSGSGTVKPQPGAPFVDDSGEYFEEMPEPKDPATVPTASEPVVPSPGDGDPYNPEAGGGGVAEADPVPTLAMTVRNLTHANGWFVGDTAAYQLVLANTAPDSTWGNVELIVPMPEGLALDTSKLVLTLTDGSTARLGASVYNASTRTLTVALGNMPGGERRMLTFEAKLSQPSTQAPILTTALAVGDAPSGSSQLTIEASASVQMPYPATVPQPAVKKELPDTGTKKRVMPQSSYASRVLPQTGDPTGFVWSSATLSAGAMWLAARLRARRRRHR